MLKSVIHIIKNSATILLVALFFSCGNEIKEVQDFLADKNLPIIVGENINLIHTDSGKVKNKLITPLLNDYRNREKHPYQEFPKGIKVITFDIKGDSTTLLANYAIVYSKTEISEVKGKVEIINHKEKSTLFTEQLFWDQSTHYIYTEKPFKLITQTDTINGKGFESKDDLTHVVMKDIYGAIYLSEKNN